MPPRSVALSCNDESSVSHHRGGRRCASPNGKQHLLEPRTRALRVVRRSSPFCNMRAALALLAASLLTWPPAALRLVSAQDFTVDGPVDIEQCADGMAFADADGNSLISRTEYIQFVKFLGPSGFLASVTQFTDLPLPLVTNFNNLACFCQLDPETPVDERATCCEGSSDTIDIPNSDPLTDRDKVILFTMCSFTKNAIDLALLPPTSAPSAAPGSSLAPVPATSVEPTPAPVVGPSPITLIVDDVGYTVGIRSGTQTDFSQYSGALIESMDNLAPDVLLDLEGRRRRLLRSEQHHRRLQSVTIPTTLTGPVVASCPPDSTASAGDTCNEVEATIRVVFQAGETVPPNFVADYRAALVAAIENGQLQEALERVGNNAPIYIVRSFAATPPGGVGNNSLRPGPVAGIVIGSALIVGILAIAFILRRRRRNKEPYNDLEPVTGDLQLEQGEGGPHDVDKGDEDSARFAGQKKHPLQTEIDGMPVLPLEDSGETPEMAESVHDSSSNAGSSGWSSSAGVSSLNTGSADGTDDPAIGIAASSALAAMSDSNRATVDESEASVPVIPTVTRADLDSAIEAGDWAAVGATAALLAAASDSQSYSSKSGQTREQSRSGSSVSSFDAARAAELDHLVDAGDWEGIVLAAAKYEAAEGNSQSNQSPSIASGSESRESRSSVGESGTFVSNSASLSQSSSPSKLKKRQELRTQVEELVRRVVPEEIQNVDEMMSQFRGREEELVETLRTMQERAVAQKARQGAQKAAKQEAKRAVQASRRDSAAAAATTTTTGLLDPSQVRTISLGVGTSQPQVLSRPPPPSPAAAALASVPASTLAAVGAGTAAAGAVVAAAAGVDAAAILGAALATPALAVAAVASLDVLENKDSSFRPFVDESSRSGDDTKPDSTEILSRPSADSPSRPFTDDVASPDSTPPKTSPNSADASSPSGSLPNMSARSLGSGQVQEGRTPTSREIKQNVLEAAIEAGDWEAVGEAAAMLSDNSMTSADTDEVDRMARGISSGSSTGSEGKNISAERAAELDELIEKGDWSGVVAAASRYSQDDGGTPQRSDSFISRQQRQQELEERRQRRLQRLKEEQDALAQAEIWMAIAEQSKQETESEDAGASDAADWAIARSLSLLVRAEQGGQLRDTPGNSDREEEEV